MRDCKTSPSRFSRVRRIKILLVLFAFISTGAGVEV